MKRKPLSRSQENPLSIIITAPETYHGPLPTVFLGGGIGGCPDWQQEVGRMIREDVALLNPRQEVFDFSDPLASARQVRWEKSHLRAATLLLFWFPEPEPDPTVPQPIALLELGRYVCDTSRPAAVGTSRGYARREDVLLQLEERPDIVVHESLEATCADLSRLIRTAALHR
jgi:hypothetical protein